MRHVGQPLVVGLDPAEQLTGPWGSAYPFVEVAERMVRGDRRSASQATRARALPR